MYKKSYLNTIYIILYCVRTRTVIGILKSEKYIYIYVFQCVYHKPLSYTIEANVVNDLFSNKLLLLIPE